MAGMAEAEPQRIDLGTVWVSGVLLGNPLSCPSASITAFPKAETTPAMTRDAMTSRRASEFARASAPMEKTTWVLNLTYAAGPRI